MTKMDYFIFAAGFVTGMAWGVGIMILFSETFGRHLSQAC
jgi:hypothetical protein